MLSSIRWYLRRAGYVVTVLRRLGGFSQVICPLCHYQGAFQAFGLPPRFDAECPQCLSLERQRLFGLLSERHGWLLGRPRVLHFAPEMALAHHFEKYSSEYVRAGWDMDGDVHWDIETLSDVPDARFDRVFASHVLEHVDDRKALAAVFRVLAPGGLFFAMFPTCDAWETTYENAAVRTEHEREVHFGATNHVRYYGRDVVRRMEDAGFVVRRVLADPAENSRYGLLRGETVFVCLKPS